MRGTVCQLIRPGRSAPPLHVHSNFRMRVLASPALINRWLNPYNWLLNTHLEREGVNVLGAAPWRVLRGQADIWHVHWPEHVFNRQSVARATFSTRTFLHLVREARQAGIRIVWTVHNLRAHDGRHPKLEEAFWDEFLELVDGLIHLSEAGRAAALARFPHVSARPGWVIPHGHYRTEYVTGHTRTAARQQLQIPATAPLVLFAGRLRPYKNVPALLQAFREMPTPAARCLVAGKPANRAVRDDLAHRADADPRVTLDLRHVPRRELAMMLRATDLVVLPYREILNSGSALLALSLNRPTLVPRQGALAELAETVGPAWVRCYDGTLSGAQLAEALAWARDTPRPAVAPLEQFGWQAIARAHRDVYATLIRGSATTAQRPDRSATLSDGAVEAAATQTA
jgi:beta-1,4-mannosyltransferase